MRISYSPARNSASASPVKSEFVSRQNEKPTLVQNRQFVSTYSAPDIVRPETFDIILPNLVHKSKLRNLAWARRRPAAKRLAALCPFLTFPHASASMAAISVDEMSPFEQKLLVEQLVESRFNEHADKIPLIFFSIFHSYFPDYHTLTGESTER